MGRAAARHPHLLVLGCAVCGLLVAGAAAGGARTPALAAVCAACAVFVVAPRSRQNVAFGPLRLAALGLFAFALGAAGGASRVAAIDGPGKGLRPGTRIDARATLLEAPRPHGREWAAVVRLASGPHGGARLLARGEAGRWPRGLRPGATLALTGTAAAPGPPLGGFDPSAWLRRRGIAAVLRLERAIPAGPPRGGAAGVLDRLVARSLENAAAGLAPRDAALARGLVLGRDEQIDALTRDDFRDSGLAHLLAASGQNVMLLCALALPLLVAARAGPRARTAALVGLIALYVPLAGAGPSIQRAGVMGAAGIAAAALGRGASRWYALLLAAAVTLAVNPRAAGDPGWQLSFAAVVGIALLPARAPGAPLRLLREGAAVTLAATLATAPLLAVHFGSVPLVAVPANLLAMPAVAPVMWAGMLRVALGFVPDPLAAGPARALGAVQVPLLSYLAALARHAAAVADPLDWRASPLAVVAAYALLLALALALRRRRTRTPPGDPVRRRRALALAAAGVALAAWWLPGSALDPRGTAPRAATVAFLDVGQGDATLVRDASGAAVLFDGGPPEARVARLLRRLGVRRLDVVVATHASRDHHGGLTEVVEQMPPRLLLDGGDGTADPGFRALVSAARRGGARVVPARAGMRVRAGEIEVEVLSPAPRPPGPPPEDPNPRAVVALVRAGGLTALLSADAESETLLPLALPDVDVLKVPHHGSADPGLSDVLARVRPEAAAIPVGAGNPHGHPAPSTLAALARAVPLVLRNDRHGTVTLTAGAEGIRATTERGGPVHPRP